MEAGKVNSDKFDQSRLVHQASMMRSAVIPILQILAVLLNASFVVMTDAGHGAFGQAIF